ncbi:UPF0711 protein C18orf21 homolog isoform X2 [Cynoglossus semilaevis]|uniref:Si:dkey-184p18.2 n=1 Tax=Cynoglossus semilaevis TaxID=244447 RepID=A0A3P8VHS3_CYNSE|nr:UPF0711 protein C18orf21 homolog isoform X2 [Cynoglossus semilaevis]
MKRHLPELTDNFRLNAALLYKDKCPELSRFIMQGLVNSKESTKQSNLTMLCLNLVCPHCYQWLQPDNHRIRLRPKPLPSLRMQRLLRRKAKGRQLSMVQKRLLQRYQKSSSVLMATCHACNKTSRHRGMDRDFIAALAKTHSTPRSGGKHKTPPSTSRPNMSTPKTPAKDKTPVHTPRSSSSSNTPGSGSSSTKSASKPKNWVVQRLSKILMKEDTKGNKKGGLKDFLSSL